MSSVVARGLRAFSTKAAWRPPHTGAAKGVLRAVAETAARNVIGVLNGVAPDPRTVANPGFRDAACRPVRDANVFEKEPQT